MSPRWMVERKVASIDRELLQVVEVYAEGENKELVKQENRQWTHRRELLLVSKSEMRDKSDNDRRTGKTA